MSTSFNGTSPQAPVRVATVSRERTPAEAVARQSHSDRPPVREQEAKPHARQGRRSVRVTLLLLVLIPLAVAGAAYYYARSQSYQSTDDAFIDDHVSNVAPKVAGRVDRVLVDDNQSVKKGIWLSSWTTGYRHGALKRFSTSPRRSPNTGADRSCGCRGDEPTRQARTQEDSIMPCSSHVGPAESGRADHLFAKYR
jgi:hypothetical protein